MPKEDSPLRIDETILLEDVLNRGFVSPTQFNISHPVSPTLSIQNQFIAIPVEF